jgi:capsular exopolysaccharide synthesis family protein
MPMAESAPPNSAASLQSFVGVLRRRLWLIALCLILVPASVIAYSLAQHEVYQATASLLFKSSGPATLLGAPTQSQAPQDERTAATNVTLAGLAVVADRTARRMGVPAGEVTGNVDVSPVGTSNLVTVDARAASPVSAAKLANTYAQEFIGSRRAAEVQDVRRTQATVQARLQAVQQRLTALQGRSDTGPRWRTARRAAERRALATQREDLLRRSGELRSLAAVETGDVELAQPATTPSSPISPRTRRNAAIGIGLGLVLGIALALLFEMLDRRLRDPAEVTELVQPPILGAIPRSRALSEPPGLAGLPPAESHAFHMLRTSLRYYHENGPLDSVLVTSAGSREGKTTVAWNLAAVSAQSGERVLLLEADLRRPSLAERFRVPGEQGLADVLRGEAELAEVAQEIVVGTHVNGATTPRTVDLVVAGTVLGDVSGLIESERMDRLIREAQQRYDLVVIDTPPMSVVPDAIPLISKVSGVVVVARLGRTTRDAVSFLNSQLSHMRAPVLGVVVNGIARQDGYYGAAAPAEERMVAARD